MSPIFQGFWQITQAQEFYGILGISSAIFLQPGELDACMLPLVLRSLPRSDSIITKNGSKKIGLAEKRQRQKNATLLF